jgi:hypothetical protein
MGFTMMITPQARRRITGAVRALDPRSRERWESWAATADGVPPYDVAAIALRALEAAEKEACLRLDYEGLDEDTRADLANDLGYIQSIETALRAEGVGR